MKDLPSGALPIRRLALITKAVPPEGVRLTHELAAWLGERNIEVLFDERTAAAIGRDDGFPRRDMPALDLVIVVGGDGTLLSVARSAGPRRIPILGVNFGGLGFLTELQPDELYVGLERILSGEYDIDERHALRVRYLHAGREHSEYSLLNDAVITKSALARMITVDLCVDGEKVATYTSDGLIISTPTGSTAYNLSAGGPILDPRMSAFVISPICPHSMTYRPLVVPGSVLVEVTLRDTSDEVYLTLDGQVGFPMQSGDAISVDQHPEPVRLVRMRERRFFEVLRRKLRWGAR